MSKKIILRIIQKIIQKRAHWIGNLKVNLAINLVIAGLLWGMAASADPGFVQIRTPQSGPTQTLPEFLPIYRDQIQANVFRLVVLSAEPISVEEYGSRLQSIRNNSKKDAESFVYKFAYQEAEKCARAELEKCILPDVDAGDSGFLASLPDEQKPYLWTRGAKFQRFKKADGTWGVPQFLLFNADGKKVFDSRTDEPARVARTADTSQPAIQSELKQLAYPSEALDWVGVELKKALSDSPLRFGTLESTNERVYLAGFPLKTWTRFSENQLVDSDGVSLYVTGGWTTGPAHAVFYATGETVDSRTSKNATGVINGMVIGRDQDARLRNFFLNFGTEGVDGFRGGPVMSRLGEVVGIYTTWLATPDENYRDFSAIGVRSDWILRSLRGSLKK